MKLFKILLATLLITLLISSASLIGYTFYQTKQPLDIETPQLLTIKDGTSFSHFSKQLIKKGWIDNRFWLRNYVRLKPQYVNIKAGTYKVAKNSSLQDLLKQLLAGKEHQFSVTFIEGTTFKEWVVQLNDLENIVHTIQDYAVHEIATELNISRENPEGLFFNL